MEIYLDKLFDWLLAMSPNGIYLVFFLITYLENVVPPIPGDLLVAFGGYLVAIGVVAFAPLLMLTTIASVIGFMSMYGVGSYWGYRIEGQLDRWWMTRRIDGRFLEKGKIWVQQWGQWVIVANRFLAGMRSVISLTAGIYRTNVKLTIINSTISSLLWNTILLTAGWLVHENWQVIGEWLGVYGWGILSLLIAIILYRAVTRRLAKNDKKRVG